jgi:ligand-binding SRPBCC domain-containing protein
MEAANQKKLRTDCSEIAEKIEGKFMKTLIRLIFGLIGIIVFLFGAFLCLGFLYPILTSEARVTINKPRDVVWAYFINQKNLKDWLPNVKSIENISGEPMTAGSKFKMTFEENGREIVMTETMTEVKEKEVFAFILENEVIKANDRITFIDKGNQTEVVENNTFEGGNIFWKSLFALMKSSFQKNSQASYDRLKTNIENIK